LEKTKSMHQAKGLLLAKEKEKIFLTFWTYPFPQHVNKQEKIDNIKGKQSVSYVFLYIAVSTHY